MVHLCSTKGNCERTGNVIQKNIIGIAGDRWSFMKSNHQKQRLDCLLSFIKVKQHDYESKENTKYLLSKGLRLISRGNFFGSFHSPCWPTGILTSSCLTEVQNFHKVTDPD